MANGGDIGAIFKELVSKESILNLAAAGITAGITNNINSSLNLNGELKLWEQLGKNIIYSAVKSGATTLTSEGSFADNFIQTAVSSTVGALANQVTQKIGNLTLESGGSIEEGGLTKILSHAAVGCAAQSLSGGNCNAGALGGAIAELLSPYLPDPQTQTGKIKSELTLVLANGIGAALTGTDLTQTIQSSLQVEQNNRQLHITEISLARQRAKEFAKQLNEDKEPTTAQIDVAQNRFSRYIRY